MTTIRPPDGALTGTFVFDADQGPSGTISDINLVSQGGTTFPGPNPYHDMTPVFGTDTAGIGRLFLVNDDSLTSLLNVRIAWDQTGTLGLSDSGGQVQGVSAFEDVCADPTCYSHWGGPARYGVSGVFTETAMPEPGTWVSVGLPLLFLSLCLRRVARKRHKSRAVLLCAAEEL